MLLNTRRITVHSSDISKFGRWSWLFSGNFFTWLPHSSKSSFYNHLMSGFSWVLLLWINDDSIEFWQILLYIIVHFFISPTCLHTGIYHTWCIYIIICIFLSKCKKQPIPAQNMCYSLAHPLTLRTLLISWLCRVCIIQILFVYIFVLSGWSLVFMQYMSW